MMQDLILCIWQNVNGRDQDFTFYSACHNTYSRIDYFLMFSRDRHRIKECKIGYLSKTTPDYI